MIFLLLYFFLLLFLLDLPIDLRELQANAETVFRRLSLFCSVNIEQSEPGEDLELEFSRRRPDEVDTMMLCTRLLETR